MLCGIAGLKPARTGSTLTLLILAVMAFAQLCPVAKAADTSDWKTNIEKVMGMKGEDMPGGVLRFELPRLDQKTFVMGMHTISNLVTGGYVAYKPQGGKIFMTGELAVLEKELNPVLDVLQKALPLGVGVEAVHNHLVQDQPRWIFVHVAGLGDGKTLATVIEIALKQTTTPRINDDNQPDADDVITGFDENKVEAILGGDAQIIDAVLEISIPCSAHPSYAGHDFPPAMGAASEFHFQSLGNGNAIAAPEICVPVGRVNSVVQILKSNGFSVSAIHNHFTKESPRVFFIHAMKAGKADALATVLKQAVDITK